VTTGVRPLTFADIDAVMEIERASFDDPWTVGMFGTELIAENRVWLAAEDDGQLVAYAGAWAVGEDAHVMNLAVRADHQRGGLGRRLLRELRERVLAMGALRLTLEVRASNEAALALYEAEGLAPVGRRPGYYPGGEDAVIMWGDAMPSTREDAVVLAIETSCDETAAAVMRGGREVLSSVVASQIDFHARFGGVVPEIASRKHTEAIVGVTQEALDQAGMRLDQVDAVAVTHGPGLVGALVVGLAFAKGLAMAASIPLVGVNHLEGHIFANVLADERVEPPLVALLVSGGHTSLVHMPAWGEYHTLGETLDDAAGEAFDKVAKVLGLGYPGGPVLSRMADSGDPNAIDFPRAMLHSGDFAFSLSGLKTAVINHIRHEREAGREIDIPDLAASFQAAVIDVQVAKAVRAVEETGVGVFCLGGGVAANPALREGLRAALEPRGVLVSVPPLHLCTDNAAMIAAAGFYRYRRGERLGLDAEAVPGLRLDS